MLSSLCRLGLFSVFRARAGGMELPPHLNHGLTIYPLQTPLRDVTPTRLAFHDPFPLFAMASSPHTQPYPQSFQVSRSLGFLFAINHLQLLFLALPMRRVVTSPQKKRTQKSW